MRLPDTVMIQSATNTRDAEGMVVQTWATVATIRADVQPFGGELAYMQYGITEAGITKRMFCEINSEVKVGRRVVVDGAAYEIRYVAQWRNHYEALLKPA